MYKISKTVDELIYSCAYSFANCGWNCE